MSDSEQIIEHLSKEIEAITNNAYAFRMRAAFTVWIGPYVLLGSLLIATHADFSIALGVSARFAVAVAAIAYFLLGVVGGLLERGAWRRCNELRRCILALAPETTQRSIGASFQDLKGERLLLPFYVIVFLLIMISFSAIFVVAAGLQRSCAQDYAPCPRASSAQQSVPGDAPAVAPNKTP